MENNGTTNVVIQVIATDFKNGQVFNVAEAEAKLKTVFGGKPVKGEQSVTFRTSNCETAKIDVDYHSAAVSEAEIDTELEVNVKGKGFDPAKQGIVDGMAASAKFAKTDVGAGKDKVVEDWFSVSAVKDCSASCADATSFYNTKTSDVK